MPDKTVVEHPAVGDAEADPRSPQQPSAATPLTRAPARNLREIIVVLAGVCAVAVVTAILMFSGKVTTDDAQVDAHITTVSTRVPGYVEKLFVNDNVDVKAGDPLAEIDPRDYQAAVDQAQANYDAAIARARTAKLDIRLTRARPVRPWKAHWLRRPRRRRVSCGRTNHSNKRRPHL